MRRVVLLASVAMAVIILGVAAPSILRADPSTDARNWAQDWAARCWTINERFILLEMCLDLPVQDAIDFGSPPEEPEESAGTGEWRDYGRQMRYLTRLQRFAYAGAWQHIVHPQPFRGAVSYRPLVKWMWRNEHVGEPFWNRVVDRIHARFGDRQLARPLRSIRSMYLHWVKFGRL